MTFGEIILAVVVSAIGLYVAARLVSAAVLKSIQEHKHKTKEMENGRKRS